jgi:PKD repeat protein
VIDTFIKYTKPGTYTVYLVIKTKKGCESKFSGTVVIPQPPVVCRLQAVFSTEKISARKFRFNSSQSTASGDSITRRIWKFGDNTSLEGNEISPLKEYKDTGVYNVCLTIKSKNGCEKQYCTTLVVRDSVPRPTNCKACFTVQYKDSTVYFNSACSTAPDGDSIISRTWYYNDSTLNAPLVLTGNTIDTFIRYSKPGTYTVYLYIKTKKGCESKYAGSVVIPPPPAATGCKATFTVSVQQFTAKFNSAGSKAVDGDSIISRTWIFGDSSQPVNNHIDPTHTYTKPGSYYVYLYIKTKKGCESKYAEKVVITEQRPCNAIAQFVATRLTPKKVQFNSIQSAAQQGDSIIQRRWNFGDGTARDGNEISPVKEYSQPGVYNACLQIKTAHGCENQVCRQVDIRDTPVSPLLLTS